MYIFAVEFGIESASATLLDIPQMIDLQLITYVVLVVLNELKLRGLSACVRSEKV